MKENGKPHIVVGLVACLVKMNGSISRTDANMKKGESFSQMVVLDDCSAGRMMFIESLRLFPDWNFEIALDQSPFNSS